MGGPEKLSSTYRWICHETIQRSYWGSTIDGTPHKITNLLTIIDQVLTIINFNYIFTIDRMYFPHTFQIFL